MPFTYLPSSTLIIIITALVIHFHVTSSWAPVPFWSRRITTMSIRPISSWPSRLFDTTTNNNNDDQDSIQDNIIEEEDASADIGDPIRAATGIRPSLHPVAINALAQLLKKRSTLRQKDPLEVALLAGQLAAEAISKRDSTSKQDKMKLSPEEQQTLAGRIVGIAVRFFQMEDTLCQTCQKSRDYLQKYNEWSSLGVLATESEDDDDAINQKLKEDPLFALNRAESLLALFLHNVEGPELERKNMTVPGGSVADFLDEDRQRILFQR